MKTTIIVGAQATNKSTLAKEMCKGKVTTSVKDFSKGKLTQAAIHRKTQVLHIDEPSEKALAELKDLVSKPSLLLKVSKVDPGVEIKPSIIITTNNPKALEFAGMKDVTVMDLSADKAAKAPRTKVSKATKPRKAAKKAKK